MLNKISVCRICGAELKTVVRFLDNNSDECDIKILCKKCYKKKLKKEGTEFVENGKYMAIW